ncbi:MAG: hypothetical protein C4529_03870 [Deltaproteobacteria bacterium]|nr:MAG: hypothetical protein C4529_03870 [Deltaproteobacteria bacterium]
MAGLIFFAIICIEYLGIGYFFPVVQALHIPLLMVGSLFLYFMFRRGVSELLPKKQTKLFLLFIALTFLSMTYANVTYYSFNVLKGQVGYFLLFAIGIYVFNHKNKLNAFLIGFVAVHVALVLMNIDVLTSQQRVESFQAGYFLGDGNDFGWSMAIVVPMSLYLIVASKRVILKIAGIISCAILVFGVVGTASRGATLAMASSLLYFVITSRRRAIPLFAMLIVAVGIAAYAPGQYISRMESIGNYSEDTSALGRITAWKAATKMAIDHPLGVGAGNFNSAYGREYRPDDAPSMRWYSVHSIYFSVLGEYGILGLITILSILSVNFRDNVRSRHGVGSRDHTETDAGVWPIYLNMALIAYAVGGIFLGGVGYPHLYMLSALTVATRVLTEEPFRESPAR